MIYLKYTTAELIQKCKISIAYLTHSSANNKFVRELEDTIILCNNLDNDGYDGLVSVSSDMLEAYF